MIRDLQNELPAVSTIPTPLVDWSVSAAHEFAYGVYIISRKRHRKRKRRDRLLARSQLGTVPLITTLQPGRFPERSCCQLLLLHPQSPFHAFYLLHCPLPLCLHSPHLQCSLRRPPRMFLRNRNKSLSSQRPIRRGRGKVGYNLQMRWCSLL